MSSDDKTRLSGELARADPILPTTSSHAVRNPPSKSDVHPAVYIIIWIFFSSSVILFNKWILDTLNFRYPVILTTYHLTFATIMTQLLARTTKLLDGRKSVKMTRRIYFRAIMPIGLCFSLSLICGNVSYLYLSVAFIQMLKATTPVATLISGWALGIAKPSLQVLLNVTVIVLGVILASFCEVEFVLVGVLFQITGVIFESLRLTMVQRVLSAPEFKMDPLVSLYYFAPICAVMNFAVAAYWELPRVSLVEFQNVGLFIFVINGLCAFMLNVSVVFLIGKTSAVVLTLSGIVKDIMLVAASMMIWGTRVTGLQFCGYSLALLGMAYYKLGYDQIKYHFVDSTRVWAEFGAQKPVLRKIAVILLTVFVVLVLFGGLAPEYAPAYDPSVFASQASSRFGVRTNPGTAAV